MNSIAIYPLTSALHDPQAVTTLTQEFLSSLDLPYELKDNDFADYGSHDLDLIFVRTGGTEGIFKRLLPQLVKQSAKPFYLLASDKSNSLAASLEILSYLRQQGLQGEILHGNAAYISARIKMLQRVGEAKNCLRQCRLGVIGEPSDWLIASVKDAAKVRQSLGVEFMDIPMSELLETLAGIPQMSTAEVKSLFANLKIAGLGECYCNTAASVFSKGLCGSVAVANSLPDAYRIYLALKSLIEKYQLQGFTLRCFDLLDAVHNTGCWALAKLNSEDIVAGCEGDVPTMLTMMVVRALCGVSCFQANPASINPETGEILFAHCTIPFDMVQRYELDTHFESGIGVGIRGYVPEGAVTICKLAGDLSQAFVAEGELLRCQAKADLCRTQLVVRLDNPTQTDYFLTNPIGNHHVVVPGRHADALESLMKLYHCC
jgi:L-fucose isomerase-like protein